MPVGISWQMLARQSLSRSTRYYRVSVIRDKRGGLKKTSPVSEKYRYSMTLTSKILSMSMSSMIRFTTPVTDSTTGLPYFLSTLGPPLQYFPVGKSKFGATLVIFLGATGYFKKNKKPSNIATPPHELLGKYECLW